MHRITLPPPWVSVVGAAWLCSSISAIAAYRLDKLVRSAAGALPAEVRHGVLSCHANLWAWASRL